MADGPEKHGSGVTGRRVTPGQALLLSVLAAMGLALARFAPQLCVVLLICCVIYSSVIFLVIAVHETGHLLGGWLVGFRFEYVRVGRLKIAREARGLRPGFATGKTMLTGFAGTYPSDDRDLRGRMAVMLVGGPAASLLTGVITLVLTDSWGYLGRDWPPTDLPGWYGHALVLTMIMSFALLVSTLLPSSVKGQLSDGEKLQALLVGGATTERYCAIVAIESSIRAGARPREWPVRWVQAVCDAPAGGSVLDAAGTHLSYIWHLDRGDTGTAGRILERALGSCARYPPGSLALVHFEAAYFYARHRGDPVEALAHFERGKEGYRFVSYPTVLRATAAINLAMGEANAARQQASEALAIIERSKRDGGEAAEADWLRELITLCDTGFNLPSPDAAQQSDPQSPHQ